MNNLIKIGIGGGLLFGLWKLLQMKKVSEKVVTALSNPRIHKVDLKGLAIRTEININNPTKGSVKITKPVVTLYSDNKYITSTKPESKEFIIKPLATTTLDTIEIVVPWTSLSSYVIELITKIPQLVDAFKTKNMSKFGQALAMPLEMKYSLYANGIYFESETQKIL
ncbi:MAG: hypothetical protein EOM05_12315 [Clostridia bacterium]|nr:hypothetical protein [Clostridia bacterium]